MSQIFHRSTNSISRVTIFGGLFAVGALLFLVAAIQRSDYSTMVNMAREQPVPFSHQHHVAGIGLDCRYCHTAVEDSSFAGIPPTQTCMNCHARIWNDAPALEPVRDSLRTGRSIAWTRVHNLADFAYFDHSIHVAKGVACVTCHGRVDKMPLMWKQNSLLMEWCLDCHRSPEKYLTPREARVKMDWEPEDGTDPAELGRKLLKDYDVHTRTDCSACHR
jgi:hypothetical protein